MMTHRGFSIHEHTKLNGRALPTVRFRARWDQEVMATELRRTVAAAVAAKV